MKTSHFQWLAGIWLFSLVHASAAVLYVDANGTNPVPPYAGWSTAATNIQDAVNAATNGDLVLATNGLYQGGTRQFFYDPSNNNWLAISLVKIPSGVAVKSVNGPGATVICGISQQGPVGCVCLIGTATLSGFTLTNGNEETYRYGGGAYCQTTNAVLNKCILVNNSAMWGGGVYSGTLNGCILTNNLATNINAGFGYGGGAYKSVLHGCVLVANTAVSQGGGAYESVLDNCVLVTNVAYYGGGAYGCVVNNSLVTSNYAYFGGGAYSNQMNSCLITYNGAQNEYASACFSGLTNCTVAFNPGYQPVYSCGLRNCILYGNGNLYGDDFQYCCADFSLFGTSNLVADPLFVNATNNDFHLQTNSPCINVGNNACVSTLTDLDGHERVVDGTVDLGAYEYQGQRTHAVHWVSLASMNPVAPYTNWLTAATNIQDAADVAQAGEMIVVDAGVYTNGGVVVFGQETNRVALTNAITLMSLDGPQSTVIVGGPQMRCVYVGSNAVVSGFTLTNGQTTIFGDITNEQSGGGAWCESANSELINCSIVSSWANRYGGGAYSGTLSNCTLIGNWTSGYNNGHGGGANSSALYQCALIGNISFYGGGAYNCTLNNCMVSSNGIGVGGDGGCGGGAYDSSLTNCVLAANINIYGGGACSSVLDNCLICSNTAHSSGGGASGCMMNNCAVVRNTAGLGSGSGSGGGVGNTSYSGTLTNILHNCIIYYNTAGTGSNYDSDTSNMTYCCTWPLLTNGIGNFTNAPLFVNLTNNFHLSSNSPCINAGNNAYVSTATDLDGNPRIAGGTVDLGAYEYQTPVSLISYAWLEQYGLSITTNTDTADADGDGMDNYQEWIAGTIPTNASSVLAMEPVVVTNGPAGLLVGWESVTNRTYYLQRATELASQPAFSSIQSNLVGQAGTTSYLDATATNGGPYFYRVGVQ